MAATEVTSPLVKKIKKFQLEGPESMKIKKGVEGNRIKEFTIDKNKLSYQRRLCVPNVSKLKKEAMAEAYNFAFTNHSGSTKMYHDLKKHFWWIKMKRDMATYITQCLTFQKVKAEHQRPGGLL